MPKPEKAKHFTEFDLIRLIKKSVTEVDGVFSLSSGRNILLKLISGDNYFKKSAIRISEEAEGIRIDIRIIVVYGSNIPQICYEIQQKIKTVIENKYKLKISTIDVTVDGVVER